jgi:hypothetical protein
MVSAALLWLGFFSGEVPPGISGQGSPFFSVDKGPYQ